MSDELITENDVMVPMRDGVRLRTDVFRPSTGGPFPVLVQRYPYSTRDGFMAIFGRQLAEQGFAVVVQSCRGRFGSEGDFYPFHPDVDDSYDTVEWAAAQPWSSGKVGMYGMSYSGMTQWTAAIARPPHLVCIAPAICTWDWTISGWYFSPSVLTLGLSVAWSAQMTAYEAERRNMAAPLPVFDEVARLIDEGGLGGFQDMARLFEMQQETTHDLCNQRPLRDVVGLRELAPWFRDMCDEDDPDSDYWRRISGAAHADEIDLPVLHVTSWHDYFTKGSLDAFVRMNAKPGQRLIVGPWNHNAQPYRPDADPDAWMFFNYGPGTPIVRFYEHHLKDEHPDFATEAPVRIYVMGENAWRDELEWPLARTEWTPLHLRANGRLAAEAPTLEDPDRFVHDPNDPVPGPIAIGDTFFDPVDLGAVALRPDVLVYRTDPLNADTEITGPVRVELWVESSASSADFVAKLVEEFPDGSAVAVCQGITRTALSAPGPHSVEIDLVATSLLVRTGHRLRLDVSCSMYPTFELNPSTGGRITHDVETATAHQQVFHDRDHPSRIILPVIPR